MRVLAATFRIAAFSAVIVSGLSGAIAQPEKLPETVPAPEVHPAPAGNILPERIGDTPVPEAKPGEKPPEEDGAKPDADAPAPGGTVPDTPESAPIPEETPKEEQPEPKGSDAPAAAQPDKADDTGLKEQDASKPAGYLPDPRSAETRKLLMPPEEISCRQRLRTLGVTFEERPAESDPAGCSMPYPISVSSLGRTVTLEPAALMNCAITEAAAKFTAETIEPAAKRELGAGLKSIGQASAYVCRPRNGTRKLSEHAFGNALDMARFNLSDGKAVDVKLQPDAKAASFFAAVRKAACGPFKTVLGPGSDADHASHFHLDLAPRRNGGTFCQ